MERAGPYPARLHRLSPVVGLPSPPSVSISHPAFVPALLRKLVSIILTVLFAAVGSLIGAMTGAMVGQAKETGFFRGASIGAISGAIFSIEVYESSLHLWHSDVSGYWSLFYMIDIFSSLLSGRLVREKVGPAMLSAVQSQMSFFEAATAEMVELFPICDTRGLSVDLVDKLPTIMLTRINGFDSTCSVCLQDFQLGETVRRLPQCQHMFHQPCIDSWLIRHGTCPLCRRDV